MRQLTILDPHDLTNLLANIRPVGSKEMNVALWVLQVVLGIFFVVHAYLLLRPPASLQSGVNYILEMPAGLRRFAAIAEGLAGLALVFPPLLHVLDWLTPLAATGLVLLMLGVGALGYYMNHYVTGSLLTQSRGGRLRRRSNLT